MVQTKMFSRIKAAIVGAAMIATTVITPSLSKIGEVTAAAKEITSLPYTFTADGVDEGARQGNVALSGSQKTAKSLLLNFTTDYTGDATVAVYGFGTSVAPDYWANAKAEVHSKGKSSFQLSVDVPAAIQGKIQKVGVGIWYPEDGSKFTLTSIEADGVADPITVDPSFPESENDKSGTYTFTDNKDGTATITATLSAQYRENPADEKTEQFDYLLTQGTDEEQYAPYKDANGDTLPEMKEGDPINSHKFMFSNFGIDDIANVRFQSFQYTIQSSDYDMSTIQYGGGINVAKGSPADTEYVKGKNGYWYNDQGAEDMEAYGDKFEVKAHGGYEATGCGQYAEIVWDVPKDVQPYVDLSGAANAVGFQYWWGKDDNQTSTDDEGVEQNYAVIKEIHLTGCVATYTRSMTVPYSKTVKAPKGTATLSSGDSAEFMLSDLNLGDRDKISAVKFTFKTASEFTKFVGATGISVDGSKVQSATGVVDGWYQTGNYLVLNNGPQVEVMWIIPDYIRDGIYTKDEGKVMAGFWYAGNGEKEITSANITDVTYYVFESKEDDLVIFDDKGIEVPDEIQLSVGDVYELNLNVEGAEFSSDRENVASVDENGVISALEEGLALITVTTPEGQEKTITVRVSGSSITTTAPTEDITTTTTTADPTDPDSVVDWSKVYWGDVDVNQVVNSADAVALAKFVANKTKYPLKNATALENADVAYDGIKGDSADMMKLIERVIDKITDADLGPQDPAIRAKATLYSTLK